MNDTLNAITSTIASEFSDVPDAAQATRIVVRLFLAAVLGGLLGWQRRPTAKPLDCAPICWWPWGRH
jgi:putative Mg2+ transporter-C (MgtC) family protein